MATFFSIGRMENPVLSFAPHQHDIWEVIYYSDGVGVARVGEQEIPFKPGTVICMPPGRMQEEKSALGFQNFFIFCAGLPDLGCPVPVFHQTLGTPIEALTRLLRQEYVLRRPCWQAVTQQIFETLISYFQQWSQQEYPLGGVEQLEQVIAENLHRPDFQVQEAYRQVAMSPTHLRRCFLQERGMSPLQYLHHLRLREAKRLLAFEALAIKEVAWRAGFTDPYYFSRWFRKQAGLSPSAYAEQVRASKDDEMDP